MQKRGITGNIKYTISELDSTLFLIVSVMLCHLDFLRCILPNNQKNCDIYTIIENDNIA